MRKIVTRLSECVYRFSRKPDYLDEVRFWEQTLASHPELISNPIYREEAFPERLRYYISEQNKGGHASPKLLEVGSGPVSILAAGVDQGLFECTAVDPLARAYDNLMRQCGLSYPIKPVSGYGEKLLKLFKKESFDIIYSSNALDHTISPRVCMSQMNAVIRSGGIVYLEGFVREGSQASWTGLHQHDLVPENGQLIHYNRQGVRTNLINGLPLQCIYEKIIMFKSRSINAFGYEVPHDIDPMYNWLFQDWYTIVFTKV